MGYLPHELVQDFFHQPYWFPKNSHNSILFKLLQMFRLCSLIIVINGDDSGTFGWFGIRGKERKYVEMWWNMMKYLEMRESQRIVAQNFGAQTHVHWKKEVRCIIPTKALTITTTGINIHGCSTSLPSELLDSANPVTNPVTRSLGSCDEHVGTTMADHVV